MKSLISLLPFLLPFLFPLHLSAQSMEYVKGYMVTLENDTIQGYIKDDNRAVLAYQFSFKNALDSRARTITTAEANSFYFEPSFYFESILVKNAQQQLEKQFLRKLVEGYTNLYQIANGKLDEYILVKTEGERLQIAKRDRIEDKNYLEDTKYFGELKYFLKDCQEVIRLKSIKYDEKSIAKLVSKYNDCIEPNQTSQSLGKGRKLRIKAGLTIGFNRYKVEISDLRPPNRAYESKGAGIRFGGLVSLAYFRKLSLQTGVIYNRYTGEGTYFYSLGFGELRHEFSNLDFPIFLKYNLTTKKMTPYLIGGVQFGKFLKGMSSEKRIEVGNTILDEQYNLTFNHIITYAGGVGVAIQLKGATELNLEILFHKKTFHIRVLPDTVASGLVLSSNIFF